MRVPRVLLACVVLSAGSMSAYGQSRRLSVEPAPGSVVPRDVIRNSVYQPFALAGEPELGPIIPIAGRFEVEASSPVASAIQLASSEVQYLPASESSLNPRPGAVPIRVICQPMAAPTVEPYSFGFASPFTGPVHPDQIHYHLSAVAAHLVSAGLAPEGEKIHEFQRKFQREHYRPLLIAHKEAQLRLLQSEIAYLKQAVRPVVGDAQVSVRIRLIELSQECHDQIARALFDGTGAEMSVGIHTDDVKSDVIHGLIDLLCERGEARVIVEPRGTVVSGGAFRILSESPPDGVSTPDVPAREPAPARQPVGISVLVTPAVMQGEKIRMDLVMESRVVDPGLTVDGSPGFRSRRLQTVVELAAGRTLAILCESLQSASSDDKSVQAPVKLLLVTPNIVRPEPQPTIIFPSAFPIPMPIEVTPRPTVFEAKVGVDKSQQ
jgi:hypothetical protein